MAAVNVTITGVLIDLYGRTISGPLKLVGEAVYSDLGIGGGPVIPPGGKPPGGPVHIWGGGNEPFPTPPIANVPGLPPTIDPPPTEPPADGATKPPPDGGGWGYHEEWGWVYKPKPDEPSPKA